MALLACPFGGCGLSSAANDRADGVAMASDGGREIALKRRKERLEAALRANLKQRKAQRRGRLANAAGPDAPETSDKREADASAKRD
jgi:hypothetical protein